MAFLKFPTVATIASSWLLSGAIAAQHCRSNISTEVILSSHD